MRATTDTSKRRAEGLREPGGTGTYGKPGYSRKPMRLISGLVLSASLFTGASVLAQADRPASTDRPKKIYTHYMGGYPVGSGATRYHREWNPSHTRHDSKRGKTGDTWRNWPLLPPGASLNPIASADLEIRRALRGGIDGFAVDAWASGENAKKTLDALFAAAEAGQYKFEITICLDPTCLESEPSIGGNAAAAITYLLDRHGNSLNLARRDGKPLVFGYLSGKLAASCAAETLKGTPGWEERSAYRAEEIRSEPAGWEVMLNAYDAIEERVGQPLFFHICMGCFFHAGQGLQKKDGSPGQAGDLIQATAFVGQRFPAVGDFLADGPQERYDTMARVTREAGAEWCEPIHYQYINWGGRFWLPRGTEMLRQRWERARANNSTLIQFATWNDYTEHTNLAPCYNTRYAMLDLNRYFIDWWKSGRPPQPEKDKVYLFHRKYPDGAPVYPFKAVHPGKNGVIEVVTILTAPATVRLPGRNVEYKAPVGLHAEQFELTPGRVAAEVLRDGKVVVTLESPEPVTDRPYRTDLGLVGFSTEFAENWRADFGDTAPFYASEYGDADNDGLPNWFEMYWFGKFLDWSTATGADPHDDPDMDGRNNLQEYLDQTDPTAPPAPRVPDRNILQEYLDQTDPTEPDKPGLPAGKGEVP